MRSDRPSPQPQPATHKRLGPLLVTHKGRYYPCCVSLVPNQSILIPGGQTWAIGGIQTAGDRRQYGAWGPHQANSRSLYSLHGQRRPPAVSPTVACKRNLDLLCCWLFQHSVGPDPCHSPWTLWPQTIHLRGGRGPDGQTRWTGKKCALKSCVQWASAEKATYGQHQSYG